MRKKIATLLLAFAFILPCSLLFTACRNDDDHGKAKVTSIAVELVSTDYTMTDNTITVPWGIKVELDSSDFTVTATLDNSETKVISEKTNTQDGFTFSSTIPNDAITPIGEYSITFSHENVEEDIEIDVNVVKTNVDMTGVEWNYTNSYTYDKTEKVVELTGLPTGVSVEYKTKLSTENGDGEVGNGATNAGSYTTTAIFTYSDTEHYNAIPNMVLNWEIEKADIVVSSVTTQLFTYDGTEKTATITSTLPEGVQATITGETTGTDADVYDIIVSFTYTGADSANYNPIADLNWSWSISPAKFTAVGSVTLSQDYNLIYNGENQSVELNLTGLDTNNVRVVSQSGLTAKDAGTHYATVELEYIGTSTNYDRVDNIKVEWEIGKAPLTVTAKDHTIAYRQIASNNGYEITGFVNNETESVLEGEILYSYNYENGNAVGSYEITPYGVTADNYTINFVKGTLTVEKAKIDFTNVDWDKNSPYTYTGSAIKPVLSSGANNVEITYTYTQGGEVVENPINVGIYVAHAEIEFDTVNYEIINNSVVDFEYEIVAQKVNVSTLTWNTGATITYTGDAIEPEITTLPNTLTVVYSYTQNSESAEPINVGTYVAHAELTTISNNYEIEGTFADLTFEITHIEVDFTGIDWTKESPYTYTGSAIQPVLNNVPETVEVTYTYTQDTNAATPINVGTYVASVDVQVKNDNYKIINNSIVAFEYEIIAQEVDCSTLAWTNTREYTFNGTEQKPTLINELEGLKITYSYFEGEGTQITAQSVVNVGIYTASVSVQPANGNYTLLDYTQLNSITFVINPAEAVLGEVGWNINTVINGEGDYSQDHNAIVEYTGEPIVINAVGNFDMFDIEYQIDSSTVETISIETAGSYYIYAYITLKDEYKQNYRFDNYSINLSLEVKVNPFETILIDGEEISYNDFVNKNQFEYLSEITFTLKDGYTAYNGDSTEIISVTVNDTYPVLIVKDAKQNEVYSRYGFDYYYFDELTINGNVALDNYYTRVKLEQGQDSFEISFDERYLTKYASMINYEIQYYDCDAARGVITSVPFVVENATNVMNIRISLNNGDMNNDIHSIDVVQYSRITEIEYTTVSFNSDGNTTKTLEDGSNWFELGNEILVGFVASVEDGYTVKYYTDYNYEQEVDLTDLNNLNHICIAVYSGEEVIETRHISISYNVVNTENENITQNDTLYTTESEFNVGVNNYNSNLTVTSLLNGSETLALTEDITTATYTLTVVYNSNIYIYSKQITIIRTLNVQDCLSEDAFESGTPYMTNTTTNEQYEINTYNNSISLYEYYDASTIKNLDLNALQFPVVEGYSVSEKSLVSVSGKTYLKLTLTSEQQTFALTESEYILYILLEFDGVYDNDTSGAIEINDVINGDIPVAEGATEINIDIATQGINITLNNNYAKAVILDAENKTLAETTYGYLSGTYNFPATGTYTLIITATDGTTKTYTINVTGEILPTLEVVVGNITLSQQNGQYGPTEGDFEWKVLDGNYTEMSFTALLGTDAQSLINEGTLTITSVRSSMLAAAKIYNNEGVEITSLENFTLTVLGDETAPYVMFYAVATVQGNTTTSYIILYLCDEIPAQKVLEVVVGDKTFTEVVDPSTEMPTGDFEMQVLNDSETAMEYMFIAYLGTYEEIPATVTLNSIYCMYTGTMTDLVSQQTFTALKNVTLTVGIIGYDTIPCVAYSIVFSPAAGFTMTVDVVLYLMDKSNVAYPAVITIGENSYNFKLNAMSFDFGDVEMDTNNGYFYITETIKNQGATSITIRLDKVWSDYSYMVLIGDAYDNYVKNVDYTTAYIDGLLQTGNYAFRVTSAENLTMTIPITFVDGLAYFDIACEGFVGYLPENSGHGLTFVRVYIVIEGVGQLPEGDNGAVVIPPDSTLEFTVTLDGENISSENAVMNKWGEIFIHTTKTRADLISKGIINEETHLITFDSFTCQDGYYFFIITGTDPETKENIYVQLVNGGYLSTDIVNINEYGLAALIMVYNTLEVSDNISQVYSIYIIFADSVPDLMEQPEFNVTVEAYGITFSTKNGKLVWDEINHYFYAILPGSVQMPTDYITINSCIITNLDGSATNLTLKGVLDGECGYSETITFDSSASIYIFSFANSVVEDGCAGYIEVCNAKGDMLYQIAIAFDYSNYMPQGDMQ